MKKIMLVSLLCIQTSVLVAAEDGLIEEAFLKAFQEMGLSKKDLEKILSSVSDADCDRVVVPRLAVLLKGYAKALSDKRAARVNAAPPCDRLVMPDPEVLTRALEGMGINERSRIHFFARACAGGTFTKEEVLGRLNSAIRQQETLGGAPYSAEKRQMIQNIFLKPEQSKTGGAGSV